MPGNWLGSPIDPELLNNLPELKGAVTADDPFGLCYRLTSAQISSASHEKAKRVPLAPRR